MDYYVLFGVIRQVLQICYIKFKKICNKYVTNTYRDIKTTKKNGEFMTESKFLKELGSRIQELREKKGLSVIGLAEKVAISRIHIYRIEAGEHAVSISTVRNIALALDVKLKNLVDVE